ncbi:hypothetical protein QBC46DRAFT_391638 [Diplogelasinospora grovesii]|uniref:Uncharacterized protein n=1 Tax=Diplogelasinospora grovesii TaxID=303347 RepID=A0AAN6N4W2_9PEZI|nr:hypothetical protein QBC46DRAFT_391638 [Diplogelasinospora grovesii]
MTDTERQARNYPRHIADWYLRNMPQTWSQEVVAAVEDGSFGPLSITSRGIGVTLLVYELPPNSFGPCFVAWTFCMLPQGERRFVCWMLQQLRTCYARQRSLYVVDGSAMSYFRPKHLFLKDWDNWDNWVHDDFYGGGSYRSFDPIVVLSNISNPAHDRGHGGASYVLTEWLLGNREERRQALWKEKLDKLLVEDPPMRVTHPGRS